MYRPDAIPPATVASCFVRRQVGMPLLYLSLVMLLGGCATSAPHGSLTSGVGLHEPRDATGGAGDFLEQPADLFQGVQQASGLEVAAWHPVGAALYLEQARELLSHLAKTPVTRKNLASQRVLSWLLREVLAGDERVDYADLKWRVERFRRLVLVRPDGYLIAALSGSPIQRMGPLTLVEGQWTVSGLRVGDFYFSRGGVLYPVNDALRSMEGPPLAELGLEKDPLNAALDGAQQAMGEMALALTQAIVHPIHTLEDLTQLPTSVARLIASSPEYFARYGAMSREDQIREAARLSTHLLMMLGSAEATVGRQGGLGAEVAEWSLTAEGELVLGRVVVAESTANTALGLTPGALSILHMASGGQGNTGGSRGTAGKATRQSPARGPGKWTYKKPTTDSKQALEYQEQITGRPAWWVYWVDGVEFDGFNGKALLEAKGASYKNFLTKLGKAQPWFESGEGFQALLEQARRQSDIARALNVPVVWHVAEVEFANFLRSLFERRGWDNITVVHTPPVP